MNLPIFERLESWLRGGAPFVWLTAGAVSISLIMVFGLLGLIAVKGLAHFWPQSVWELEYQWQGKTEILVGELHGSEFISPERLKNAGLDLPGDEVMVQRHLLKIGNRDIYGVDFRNIVEVLIHSRNKPKGVVVVERQEFGDFYGFQPALMQEGQLVADGDSAWHEIQRRIITAKAIRAQIHKIEKKQIGRINYRLERLRVEGLELEQAGELNPDKLTASETRKQALEVEYQSLQETLQNLRSRLNLGQVVFQLRGSNDVAVDVSAIVHAYQPNRMSLWEKLKFYGVKVREFIWHDPREANTEGGVFPAIFGTVLMVLIMSVIVTPLGVIAAVYLSEFARDGIAVRVIRVFISNLAGVPSIVYGVFGLGFFVYFLGEHVDKALFSANLPTPTFGTPGIFWASLTLALLTLPVVIVSTEEGLARIPRSIREGSLALGATQAETLWRTILPMSSPAIITGLILAVARAAGEVAPLMLVGVVKLAPALPVDGEFPFLHLDRKFMHLGFHIYDVGFQSPNVEAARPLVYATALLLVLVIVLLNLSAILIRNRLRERYRFMEH